MTIALPHLVRAFERIAEMVIEIVAVMTAYIIITHIMFIHVIFMHFTFTSHFRKNLSHRLKIHVQSDHIITV